MDIVEYISPFEYIGSSIGKINQNFTNLQTLPIALSAKYIQIDSFITSIRSQLVTDTAIVSGNASVRDTFRAEGPVVLGADNRVGDDIIVYSWPIYLTNTTETARALVFGGNTTATTTNLYRTLITGRPTLQTDGDFRSLGNMTIGGNLWLSGDTWIGDSSGDTTRIRSGNIFLENVDDTSRALHFGTTNPPKLFRGGNNLLDVEGSLETTQSLYVSGSIHTSNLNISGACQFVNTTTAALNVTATAQFGGNIRAAGIGTGGDTNNVVVRRATTNLLETRVANSKIWDTAVTLADTGTGTANIVPKYTDADTIGNSNITDDGTTITLNGRLSLKNNIAAGTAALVATTGAVTVTNAACTTSSIVIVTLRTASNGAATVQYRATPGSGSFVITALNNAGNTNTADTSTLSWILVNTVA